MSQLDAHRLSDQQRRHIETIAAARGPVRFLCDGNWAANGAPVVMIGQPPRTIDVHTIVRGLDRDAVVFLPAAED